MQRRSLAATIVRSVKGVFGHRSCVLRIVLAAFVVGAATLVAGSVGASGVGAHGFVANAVAVTKENCEGAVFNVNNGNGGSWVGNDEPDGLSFVDGDHSRVTFHVDSGYEVTALCVRTKNGLNVPGDYTVTPSSPPPPIVGPTQLTITAAPDIADNSGIIHVGFTVQQVPPPLQPIVPLLVCVSRLADGSYLAHFGYNNPNTTQQHVAVGPDNGFTPDPPNRGQVVDFAPGIASDAFQEPFDGSTLTWHLQGKTADASSSSTPCGGALRVTKALVPANDPGRFDLQIDGTTHKVGAANTGTTGSVAVSAGPRTVSEIETANTGTSLANYDTTISCDTTPVTHGTGPSLSVQVPAGGAVACTITNTRKGGPGPGPGKIDLSITKTASPKLVELGGIVTWKVTVTNHGPDEATNVVVTDQWDAGLKYVKGSLTLPDNTTCSGKVCTLPTLAPNESATGTFQTKAIAVGNHANAVTVKADQAETDPTNNAASDDVYVVAPPEPPTTVIPKVDCVEQLAGGSLRAHFDYINPGSAAVVIPVGSHNEFVPDPQDRGQPDQFLPGESDDVVQVDFTGTLTWHLKSKSATASSSSPKCEASLRVDKSLTPSDDPGRFDLQINGSVQGTGANVTDRGTTGDVSVAAGPHVVSEAGAQGTDLADYDSEIVCRSRGGSGAVVASGTGTSLTVVVGQNDPVVCVVVNVRKGTPEPPIPPIPPITPVPPTPPTPGTPSADLSVTKTVTPITVSVGGQVTATIAVANQGPDPATNVVVTALNEPAATLVSVKPSQGTCANRACQLGTIPPGGQATITVVARVTIVGVQVDTVLVRGAEVDPAPANNVASALVHVNSFTPPSVRPVCAQIRLTPHVGTAGQPFALRARVVDRTGKAISGAPVRAHGVGVDLLRRTNRLGVARFVIKPRRAGLLAVRGGVRAACTGRVGVVSLAASASLTG